MIFIANKTREIEKDNYKLKKEISKLEENIKINKIEFIAHQNSSYLIKLYSLYFSEIKKNNTLNIVSIDQFTENNRNIQLINSENQ